MWGDRFRELTLGALETGVAVADFDRDGHLDIFTVSKNGPCALYRQPTLGHFENVAAATGVDCVAQDEKIGKVGATVVDINQDGWPDIYVCRYDAPKPALRQQRRRHLHRTRPRVWPRYHGCLRPRLVRGL